MYRKRKHTLALNWDDDKILYMFKGMSPANFEKEMAEMFRGLGYNAEVVGGANDGGIDVIAHKDGKRYYIQCKKFITREVTPHDVRDFLGAITNANNPADKGYFITTGGFTLMATKAAEGNPRIELIDGNRLIEYYKMARGNKAAEPPAHVLPVW
jgi:restriction system protein